MSLLLAALLISPTYRSQPVGIDADDPALWAQPNGIARMYGTDKDEANGAIVVFDERGRILQRVGGVRRPNNVDVEYGLAGIGDILVATERKADRLRIFRIDPSTGRLKDVTGTTGTSDEPMGVGLYRRSDGQIFAIVSPKTGPREGYLKWYHLRARDGIVDAIEVRRGGRYSGTKEIESILVDDEAGKVWYSDENVGNRCVPADPRAKNFGRELAFLNRTGFKGDHEGIAVIPGPLGGGYLLFTDQRKGGSIIHVHDRKAPYRRVNSFSLGADDTDGIEATPAWGRAYPEGIVMAMNSKGRNFIGASWGVIARRLNLE